MEFARELVDAAENALHMSTPYANVTAIAAVPAVIAAAKKCANGRRFREHQWDEESELGL